MKKHELSVTMAKRETDFINDCMNNNELEVNYPLIENQGLVVSPSSVD